MQLHLIARLMIAGIVSTLMGCATPGLFKMSKDDYPKAGPKNPVARIVGMWQPSMGAGLQDKTCRGFSAQVFFFTQNSEIPVKVDGDVRFYVFDDQGTPDEQVKPLYEGNFAPDAWNHFLGKGPMGASYQIFIPYIRPGDHTAQCTLRVRYTPRGGGAPVYSDIVEIVLEGKKKMSLDDASPTGGDAVSSGSEAADRLVTGHAQQPPHARGISKSITIHDDAASPRRRTRAPELTDSDRQRMIREVQARLESETGGSVALVSHDEPDAEPSPARKRPSARRPRNPLLDDDPPPRAPDDGDQARADEPDDSGTPDAEPPQPAAQRRHHLLDDDEDASPEPPGRASDPTWRKRRTGESARPQSHPLDSARQQPPQSPERSSAQTYTIQLSKSVFDGS